MWRDNQNLNEISVRRPERRLKGHKMIILGNSTSLDFPVPENWYKKPVVSQEEEEKYDEPNNKLTVL